MSRCIVLLHRLLFILQKIATQTKFDPSNFKPNQKVTCQFEGSHFAKVHIVQCTQFFKFQLECHQSTYLILLFELYFPSQNIEVYTLQSSRCKRVLTMWRFLGTFLILVFFVSLSACVQVVKRGFLWLHILLNSILRVVIVMAVIVNCNQSKK